MRRIILETDTLEKARREELEATAPKELPKAVGALTCCAVAAARRLAVDLWRWLQSKVIDPVFA